MSGPRYDQIATELRSDIQAGELAVGDALPSEAALRMRFGVSRFTIREALRRLEDLGLVTTSQGAATRIVATAPTLRFLVSMTTELDVLQYARDTVLDTSTSWKPASAAAVAELELDSDHAWLTVDAVRRSGPGGDVIGVTRVAVPSTLAQTLARIDVNGSSAIFVKIVNDLGVTDVQIEQELYATCLTPAIARKLRADPGAPALAVVRRFSAPDIGLFEVARTIHPADRFRYRQTLTNTKEPTT